MNDLNEMIASGRLTRDPEIKVLPTGTKLTTFGLAVRRSWKGQDDNWNEKVVFMEVQAWNGQGESLAGKVKKGEQLVIKASYDVREWTDSEGNKRISPQFNLLNWWKPYTSKNNNTCIDEEKSEPEPVKKRGRPSKKEMNTPAPAPEPKTSSDEEDDDDSIPF